MPRGLCLPHDLAQADTAGGDKAIPGLSKKKKTTKTSGYYFQF